MTPRTWLATGLVFALALGLPVAALGFQRSARAIDLPPPPPTTYHGTAGAATPGKPVVALVLNGGSATACGVGLVLNDQIAGIVYVVDVVSDVQRPGCGVAGRQIRLYFPGEDKMATATTGWQDPGLRTFNVNLGPQLTARGVLPQISRATQ
jgi:hypothetical protein